MTTPIIVIIVISIFALCCLGWAIWLLFEERKRRTELETVNEEKRAADSEKRGLQTRLDTANDQIESFDLQLKTANNQIGNFQIKLERANSEIGNFRVELDVATSEIKNLRTQLTAAESEVENLRTQLTQANREKRGLQTQLDTANTEVKTLGIRLTDTENNKKDAQWLSHLSVVSLQRSVGALCGERRHSARLKRDRDQTMKNYLEFCRRVKEQAEAKVVRKGVAVAFSFVPGLGVLDVLLDAGDIVGDVTDASEAIETVSSAIENSTEVPDDIVIEFPQLMTSDDMSVALIQDAQSTFRESFEETFKEDIDPDSVEALDGAKLDIFVTETLQDTKDLMIQSMIEARQQEIINNIFEKVEDFVGEFQDYRELLKEEQRIIKEQQRIGDDSETD